MRVLITGFEPFGGDAVNPSAMLVERLAAEAIPGIAVLHVILPCAFAPLEPALRAALAAHRPDVLVGFGLAAGRDGISLERVAINVIDARIPDNEGLAPIDEPVVPNGPAAYFSTLPIKTALVALREAGIPADVSQTAGTFACNAMFYLARHLASTMKNGPRAGFVHLPCLPEMPAALRGAPSLPLETQVTAGRLVLQACLSRNTAPRIAAGAIA